MQADNISQHYGRLKGGIDIDDIQDVQVLQDKCQVLAQSLGLDDLVLHKILGCFQEPFRYLEQQEMANVAFINALIGELDFQKERVNSVIKRLDGTILLVGDSLFMREAVLTLAK